MSRPVIIRKGTNSIKDFVDKTEKLIEFGDQFHMYFPSLDIPTFNVTVDDYGGVVTHQNRPLGVIGVPSSVTGDNSIRIISIFNMDYNNPETGTTSDTLVMYNPDCGFNGYNFTGPSMSNNGATITTYTSPFVDGWHDYKLMIDIGISNEGESWKTSATINNKRTSGYSIPRGYSPASFCAWRYNPISSVLNTQGYWYLPSVHELIEEGVHLTAIDSGFLSVKNQYNIGIGRIPYYDSTSSNNAYSYWTSRYNWNNGSWGGMCNKYNVKNKLNRNTYLSAMPDPGLAQAWCKLIKDNGKWILDPTYHID